MCSGDEIIVSGERTGVPILFNLDGTLCDFAGGMARFMQPLEGPGESHDYDNYSQDVEPNYMRARRRMVKQLPGFWRNLAPYEPGFQLLKLARDAGLRLVIFTKGPIGQPRAFMEKVEWCRTHIGEDFDISLVTDKGLHYGKILVDDWPPYIEKWLAHRPRGRVIMPLHPYNKTFEHPQVVRFRNTKDDRQSIAVMFEAAARGELK